jgi:glycine/D-amino acid oxidase-like deaminating enzyme
MEDRRWESDEEGKTHAGSRRSDETTTTAGHPADASAGDSTRAPASATRLASEHGAAVTRRAANDPDAINPLQGAPGQATPWTLSFRPQARPPLAQDATADVCVIGAGIAGLSVAYEIAASGLSVIVLDDGAIGSGMTSRTTAHLSSALDDRFYEIERLHGVEEMKLVARSHEEAIDTIERTIRTERIDCDFERVPGYLFLPEDGKLEDLDKDLAGAKRAGLEVSRVAKAPLDGFDTGPCNRFENQAAFHPLKYLDGLVRAIERLGGLVCPTTHADSWTTDRPSVVTTTPRAKVTSGAVVFATNVPINDRLVIHSKQAPYLTHVIAARVPEGSVPRALYWDLADPYHYVRLAPCWRQADQGCELLIVGGDDYKTGQGAAGEPLRSYARLEAWARARFPTMKEVLLQWSGQVMEPVSRSSAAIRSAPTTTTWSRATRGWE